MNGDALLDRLVAHPYAKHVGRVDIFPAIGRSKVRLHFSGLAEPGAMRRQHVPDDDGAAPDVRPGERPEVTLMTWSAVPDEWIEISSAAIEEQIRDVEAAGRFGCLNWTWHHRDGDAPEQIVCMTHAGSDEERGAWLIRLGRECACCLTPANVAAFPAGARP